MTGKHLQADPEPISELLELMRPLSGSEIKLLAAIVEHYRLRKPLTNVALAASAGIDRTSVWRTIPGLVEKGYLDIRPTAKAERLVNLLSGQLLGGPEVSLMLHVPARDAVAICNARPGLTGVQNATPPADSRNAPRSAETSQQLTRTKESTGYVSEHVRRGKDLGRQTANALKDTHSIGQHIQLWYQALTLDEAHGNRTCENTILSICRDLQEREARSGRKQGAAFTARVKQMLLHAKNP